MSTGEAYERYDSALDLTHESSEGMRRAIVTGSLEACGRRMFNVFEQAQQDADTAAIKSIMSARGALGCALSGSGSAVAGLFGHRETAEDCIAALGEAAREAFLCAPVGYGAKIVHIS